MCSLIPMGGYVLVGGRSRRMGRDKAFMRVQGRPLFLRAAELLRQQLAGVALLGPAGRFGGYGFPVIPDRLPNRGPLMALCTGLESSNYDWNVFLACDLPFVGHAFLRLLVERALASRAHVVVPHTSEGWQPLCAAYNKSCLPALNHALQEGRDKISSVFRLLPVDPITTRELDSAGICAQTFHNMNTMKDWSMAKRQLEAA